MKSENFKSLIKNIGLTVLGTVILALGGAIFIIPFDLVTGGMSGIAIVVNNIIPSISVNLIITVLSWGLFFTGWIILGKHFALQTLISAIVYPIAISLFSILVNPDILGGLFYLKGSAHADIAIIIATVFGGFLSGTGCAVTFWGGGSTGGTDIIAFAVCKVFKKLRSSYVFFAVDAAVIIAGMLVIKDLTVTLLGIIAAFVAALAIDKIFVGGSQALIAQIISNNCQEINRQVINRLKRTTSLINITGGYSGEPKQMLMVSFTVRQYTELKNIINQTDKNAFVTVHRAHEINGEGWTR